MDTVIKIINNKEEVFLGASNFGYDNLLFKGCKRLITVIEDNTNHDAYSFCYEHFKIIDGTSVQDIEAVIDIKKKTLYFEDLLNIKEEENPNYVKKVNFDRVNLLFKHLLSYEEFNILYNFIYSIGIPKDVLINEKYHLIITWSKYS